MKNQSFPRCPSKYCWVKMDLCLKALEHNFFLHLFKSARHQGFFSQNQNHMYVSEHLGYGVGAKWQSNSLLKNKSTCSCSCWFMVTWPGIFGNARKSKILYHDAEMIITLAHMSKLSARHFLAKACLSMFHCLQSLPSQQARSTMARGKPLSAAGHASPTIAFCSWIWSSPSSIEIKERVSVCSEKAPICAGLHLEKACAGFECTSDSNMHTWNSDRT